MNCHIVVSALVYVHVETHEQCHWWLISHSHSSMFHAPRCFFLFHFSFVTANYSLLTLHWSVVTPHFKLIDIPHSFLIPNNSLLTLHYSPLISVFPPRFSPFISPFPFLTAPHFSLLTVTSYYLHSSFFSSLLASHFWFFVADFLLLTPHPWIIILQCSLLTVFLLTPHPLLLLLIHSFLTHHSSLFTVHSLQFNPHSSLLTAHIPIYTSYFDFLLLTPHLSLPTASFFLLRIPDWSLLIPHSTLPISHYPVLRFILHYSLHTLHTLLPTSHLVYCFNTQVY